MSTSLAALEYARLKHVGEVAPLSDADEACLAELREVLLKHEAIGRFGITLLHRHFDVHEDELLIETCDIKNRTLTTKPYPLSEAGDKATLLETSWTFDPLKPGARCRTNCRTRAEHDDSLPPVEAYCH